VTQVVALVRKLILFFLNVAITLFMIFIANTYVCMMPVLSAWSHLTTSSVFKNQII